jgi:CubicO group peptidase (beta-lactamase class C family)
MSSRPARLLLTLTFLTLASPFARAGTGDPQLRTDHPWYPGELACSTFERLFATQAAVYERVVGVKPVTDEQKALAAWLWRNTHYWHAEEGAEDLWGQGFTRGSDLRGREYWTGMFAHGFGLCGTTHAQWAAEMEALLGHGRGRCVGVEGHNSFEVYLIGGPYGAGKWALLDHDISTVIFDRDGKSLLSIAEVQRDWKRLTDRRFAPEKQHGWLVCGLHPDDGNVYSRYVAAEYLPGYSGPPPMVHLRRGEKLRRYLEPGLEDGKTFVFWGRNMNAAGIPGPERSHTWVNQPEKMHGSRDGAGYHPGQARYGNAVYTYRPDFTTTHYREGVIAEDDKQVTFEFYTPYIIAATPPNSEAWGNYDRGCRNGLVLHGRLKCRVSVSTDQGKSWHDAGAFADGMDLTDHVKGHRQYWLRFHAGAKELAKYDLTMVTICQANPCTMPRLKDGGSRIEFLASGRAVVSAGPNRQQAEAHLIAGRFGTPQVTLEIATPRKEQALAVYAAAHVQSGNPPNPDVRYQIEYSTDAGTTWRPLVKDWTIPRRGDEPGDFWSQSLCWGSAELGDAKASTVQIRFRNNGGKVYIRCEAHLVYQAGNDRTRATFAWTDDKAKHEAVHDFSAQGVWDLPTGRNVRTRWVELKPAAEESKPEAKAADPKTIVDRVVEPFLKDKPHAGLVVGVIKGDARHVYCYGKVTLGGKEQAPAGDTLFEIGSITKVFTGTLLAELVRAGTVRLDDPAQKHLGDLVVLPRRDDRDIALLHLATHSSSLPVQPLTALLATMKDPKNPYGNLDIPHLRTALENIHLERAIGCDFEYSNLGVGLLGHALAQTAKAKSYEELLIDRMLKPLEMADTRIHLSESQRQRLAPGHDRRGKPTSPWDFACLEACGGLRSTANDMLTFLSANLGQRQTALLPAFRMAQQAWRDAGRKGEHVGLCWIRQKKGEHLFVWHNGGTGGYRSYMALLPDKNAAVLVLCNADNPVEAVGESILKRLLSEE